MSSSVAASVGALRCAVQHDASHQSVLLSEDVKHHVYSVCASHHRPSPNLDNGLGFHLIAWCSCVSLQHVGWVSCVPDGMSYSVSCVPDGLSCWVSCVPDGLFCWVSCVPDGCRVYLTGCLTGCRVYLTGCLASSLPSWGRRAYRRHRQTGLDE